jgi:ribonucleoside-triphosphate reductase
MEELLKLSKDKIDLCCSIFKLKKVMLKDVSAPFLKQNQNGSILVDFDSLVYTIGVIGINEVSEILYGKSIHEDQHVFIDMMKFVMKLKNYCKEKSQEFGITIAFARTPAETTAQRFATLDLLLYGDAHKFVKGNVKEAIKYYSETCSTDLPIYYTNGTHVPVDSNITMQEKIKIEQAFFPILDGGNICNIYLGERRPDPRGLMDMTLKLCKSTNLGYFAFTKDFTIKGEQYELYTD